MELIMRAVRSMVRGGVLMLVGVAVFYGVVLLFRAQVALDQYAAAYLSDQDTPEPGRAAAAGTAPGGPVLASVQSHAAPRVGTTSDAQPAPAAAGNEASAFRVVGADAVADAAPSDRRVDVVLVRKPGSGLLETSAVLNDVVLDDVRVLTIEPVAAHGDEPAAHMVTLDVDRERGRNLLLASKSGTLSLILRRDREHAAAVHQTEQQPRANSDISVNDTPVRHTPARNTPVRAGPGRRALDRDAGHRRLIHRPPIVARDDPHFVVVRVHRPGAQSSMHRVPRER
jgi:hypothetical protein